MSRNRTRASFVGVTQDNASGSTLGGSTGTRRIDSLAASTNPTLDGGSVLSTRRPSSLGGGGGNIIDDTGSPSPSKGEQSVVKTAVHASHAPIEFDESPLHKNYRPKFEGGDDEALEFDPLSVRTMIVRAATTVIGRIAELSEVIEYRLPVNVSETVSVAAKGVIDEAQSTFDRLLSELPDDSFGLKTSATCTDVDELHHSITCLRHHVLNEIVSHQSTKQKVRALQAKSMRREENFQYIRSELQKEIAALQRALTGNPCMSSDPNGLFATIDVMLLLTDADTSVDAVQTIQDLVTMLKEEENQRLVGEDNFTTSLKTVTTLREDNEKMNRQVKIFSDKAVEEQMRARQLQVQMERLEARLSSRIRTLEDDGRELKSKLDDALSLNQTLKADNEAMCQQIEMCDDLMAKEKENLLVQIATLTVKLHAEHQKARKKWTVEPDAVDVEFAKLVSMAGKIPETAKKAEILPRLLAVTDRPDDPRKLANEEALKERIVHLSRELALWKDETIQTAVERNHAAAKTIDLEEDLTRVEGFARDNRIDLVPFSTARDDASTVDTLPFDVDYRPIVRTQRADNAVATRRLQTVHDRTQILMKKLQDELTHPELSPTALGPTVLAKRSSTESSLKRMATESSSDNDEDDEHTTLGTSEALLEAVEVVEELGVAMKERIQDDAHEIRLLQSTLAVNELNFETERNLWMKEWANLMSQLPPALAARVQTEGCKVLKNERLQKLLQDVGGNAQRWMDENVEEAIEIASIPSDDEGDQSGSTEVLWDPSGTEGGTEEKFLTTAKARYVKHEPAVKPTPKKDREKAGGGKSSPTTKPPRSGKGSRRPSLAASDSLDDRQSEQQLPAAPTEEGLLPEQQQQTLLASPSPAVHSPSAQGQQPPPSPSPTFLTGTTTAADISPSPAIIGTVRSTPTPTPSPAVPVATAGSPGAGTAGQQSGKSPPAPRIPSFTPKGSAATATSTTPSSTAAAAGGTGSSTGGKAQHQGATESKRFCLTGVSVETQTFANQVDREVQAGWRGDSYEFDPETGLHYGMVSKETVTDSNRGTAKSIAVQTMKKSGAAALLASTPSSNALLSQHSSGLNQSVSTAAVGIQTAPDLMFDESAAQQLFAELSEMLKPPAGAAEASGKTQHPTIEELLWKERVVCPGCGETLTKKDIIPQKVSPDGRRRRKPQRKVTPATSPSGTPVATAIAVATTTPKTPSPSSQSPGAGGITPWELKEGDEDEGDMLVEVADIETQTDLSLLEEIIEAELKEQRQRLKLVPQQETTDKAVGEDTDFAVVVQAPAPAPAKLRPQLLAMGETIPLSPIQQLSSPFVPEVLSTYSSSVASPVNAEPPGAFPIAGTTELPAAEEKAAPQPGTSSGHVTEIAEEESTPLATTAVATAAFPATPSERGSSAGGEQAGGGGGKRKEMSLPPLVRPLSSGRKEAAATPLSSVRPGSSKGGSVPPSPSCSSTAELPSVRSAGGGEEATSVASIVPLLESAISKVADYCDRRELQQLQQKVRELEELLSAAAVRIEEQLIGGTAAHHPKRRPQKVRLPAETATPQAPHHHLGDAQKEAHRRTVLTLQEISEARQKHDGGGLSEMIAKATGKPPLGGFGSAPPLEGGHYFFQEEPVEDEESVTTASEDDDDVHPALRVTMHGGRQQRHAFLPHHGTKAVAATPAKKKRAAKLAPVVKPTAEGKAKTKKPPLSRPPKTKTREVTSTPPPIDVGSPLHIGGGHDLVVGTLGPMQGGSMAQHIRGARRDLHSQASVKGAASISKARGFQHRGAPVRGGPDDPLVQKAEVLRRSLSPPHPAFHTRLRSPEGVSPVSISPSHGPRKEEAIASAIQNIKPGSRTSPPPTATAASSDAEEEDGVVEGQLLPLDLQKAVQQKTPPPKLSPRQLEILREERLRELRHNNRFPRPASTPL